MSLQLFIGRAGSGKTHKCLAEIKEKLLEDSIGSPIIYLVPDQMTFQSEYDLINTPGLGGMMRAQVFSFTRLAWRVLQETGGMSRFHLDSVGIHMVLRKIIEHRSKDLKLFSKASEKTGFISQVEEMIAECKRYMIDSSSLQEKRESLQSEHQTVLADKLHDLQLIFEEMDKHLAHKYVDSEDYLRLLAEKMEKSSYIQQAEVFIDGFHSFTPQELEVVEKLMATSKKVTIALTVDKLYEQYPPHDLSLFRMTGSTLQQITEMARNLNIDIAPPVFFEEGTRYKQSRSLAHLETYFDSRPTVPFEGKSDIAIAQAVNRRAEIEGVAREIKKLVREKGYRYQDIALLVRNGSDYKDMIDTLFKDYEIPFFIDQKRSMLNHPLIELIRSSLEVINGFWRYEAVFRCIKTDLLTPVSDNKQMIREDMDMLENFVLGYGIQGSKWTNDQRWVYRRVRGLEDEDLPQTDKERETEDKLNDLREMIVGPLMTLQQRFKRAKNGSQMCESLFLFLQELEIPKKIEILRDEAEKAGRLEEAREHDQVWKAVLDLLDQFVEIMANEKVSLKLFSNMLESGLESMKFALVPPAIDQVLIASLERSRFSNVKCSFIIGANDGVLPARPNEEGILSEQDREQLQESGLLLAPGSRQQLLDENFIIYGAFTSASQRVYVSYPLANEEGKSLMPSIMIKRLKDLFPSIQELYWMNEPGEQADGDQLNFIANPSVSLSYLATQLLAWKRHYPIHDMWWDVYNFYSENEEWQDSSKRVLSSLFYENKTKKLSNSVTKVLFGDHIQGSVSRMEVFQACPFSHFANYGLRLKERQVFRLEAPDIGQLFHAALKQISDILHAQQKGWKDLTKEQCDLLAHQAVEMLAPKLQREILLSSNRHNYIKHKLQKIISRASVVLSEHAKASGFAPVGLELAFGKNGPLPPIQFTLDNGTTMELVGRIDRVDKAESSKGMLLRIVDYKSSQKALNLTEVFYGLALQMLTYLDVVITHSKDWLKEPATPAGVLYFHVHNPMINSPFAMSEEKLEEEIFKRFKMKGLLLGDEESVRLMDQSLEHGHSQIVSAALKKDGSFYSNSSIASEEELGLLRGHVRSLFKKIGTDITEGVIDIAPYKLKNKTPCTFCSFKSVCQFDQSLEENEYRSLIQEKNDTILEKIRKGGIVNE
ncbi:helicase-exonuclease AddAB subunit AddB [Bacillus timonensis]|nr:helicase-exonuclease AddAB subunit AddB [Bacillus timonensis]